MKKLVREMDVEEAIKFDSEKLLNSLLEINIFVGQSAVIGDFCREVCPQKKKIGGNLDWAKHCGHYLGESSCKDAENFYKLYKKSKEEGVDL